MKPFLSIVSGTYNRLELLQAMITSARANIPEGITYEFVIVDGGSTDGTLDWLRGQYDIHLIKHGELRGAIKAFTEGAFAARGKYVILANDDIEFSDGSILPALVHLEEFPNCGAVAFADNRPLLPHYTHEDFKVLRMPANQYGRQIFVPYAQVGMFRKWLGDRCKWWLGTNDEMNKAWTYGGDNCLSAHIWELGYSVDEVVDCKVIDRVHDDGLRRINSQKAETEHDSDYYYDQWRGRRIPAPMVYTAPRIPQEDKRQLRLLYLPIYEPGWAIQKLQKCGLRDALVANKSGQPIMVYEHDYLSGKPEDVLKVAAVFKPHMILTQIQAHEPLTPAIMQRLREQNPRALIVNWNGDYWPDGLTHPKMLSLLKAVDLQLVINASVLPLYKQHGIKADYWQIGFEDAPTDSSVLPTPPPDVVFLANAYSEARQALGDVLREFGAGLYGSGWVDSLGQTTYDFITGKIIYRDAKIAIGDNQYPDAYGFVSNRLFQALAAGGALLLHQTVPGLEEYTGLLDGVHYISWTDFDDLRAKLRYWLDPANEADRMKIVHAGERYTRYHHSFDRRVEQLFALIKQHIPVTKRAQDGVKLHYIGRVQTQQGVTGVVTGLHYLVQPGQPLTVDKLDAEFFLRHTETWRLAGEYD